MNKRRLRNIVNEYRNDQSTTLEKKQVAANHCLAQLVEEIKRDDPNDKS